MANRTNVTVPCQTHSGVQKITFIVGYPEPMHHPIHFQNIFQLSKGVATPQSLMDALSKVQKLAKENSMDFVELVEYAVKANNEEEDIGENSENNNVENGDSDG